MIYYDADALSEVDGGDDFLLPIIREQVLPDSCIESRRRLDAAPNVEAVVTARQAHKCVGSLAQLRNRPALLRNDIVGKSQTGRAGELQARETRTLVTQKSRATQGRYYN